MKQIHRREGVAHVMGENIKKGDQKILIIVKKNHIDLILKCTFSIIDGL